MCLSKEFSLQKKMRYTPLKISYTSTQVIKSFKSLFTPAVKCWCTHANTMNIRFLFLGDKI